MAEEAALPQAPEPTVNVLSPAGRPMSLPQSQVQAAVANGFRIPSAQEVQAYRDQEKYGSGLGNLAGATALGAARGATFGLSDQLLTHLGAIKPETLSGLKQANPIASGIGEVGGVGAGLLLGGEGELAGAAGEAANATKNVLTAADLANPVSAVSKLGGKAAASLGPANTLAGKALAGGIGSAVEGGFYGLGNSISEDALGDDKALNAEKILANVGYGALLGGALGAALPVAEAGVYKAADLVGNAGARAKEALGNIAGNTYAKTSAFVSGRPEEEILEGLKSRAMNVQKPSDIHEMVDEFHSSMKDQVSNTGKVMREANMEARPEETKALLVKADPQLATDEFARIQTAVGDAVKELRAKPELYPPRFAAKLEEIGTALTRDADKIQTPFQAFEKINETKQLIDNRIPFTKEISGEAADAVNLVKGLRSDLKKSLENQDVWGEAAARQAAFNDAQNRVLTLTGRGGDFRKHFMEDYSTRSGAKAYRYSETKGAAYLKQMGTTMGDVKSQALNEYLEAAQNMADQAKKSYESYGEVMPRAAASDEIHASTKILRTKAEEQIAHNKLMNRLSGGAHNTYLGEAAALGVGISHPVLGGAIEGISMLRNPGLAIQRLSALERMTNATSRAIAGGAKALFKAAVKTSGKLAGYAGAKWSESYNDTKEKHDKIATSLNDLGNDPNRLMDKLQRATAAIHDTAPEHSQALQTKLATMTAFLHDKLPTTPQAGPLAEVYQPSPSEIAKFNAYYKAAVDPMSVLQDAERGTLSNEAMESMQAVNPKLLQEMQAQVMSGLIAHKAKHKNAPIPYARRMAMGKLLGQDLDGSLNGARILSNQMAIQASAIKAVGQSAGGAPKGHGHSTQGGLNKLNLSSSLMTDAQKSVHRVNRG